MERATFRIASLATIVAVGFATIVASRAQTIRTLDQGPDWSAALRDAYYTQDQGSQLIPLAWLEAFRATDGTPFVAGLVTRYGYLASSVNPDGLPVGFTVSSSKAGPSVGLTCAACHTRDLSVSGQTYRVDGGPAFADFGAFVVDLDAAGLSVLASDAAFAAFAARVLGPKAAASQTAALHADVALWSLRFHTLIDRSVPKDRLWGPARVDAISMIYNHLAGLDLGPAPSGLIPENIAIANAPTRYPFLWNAGKQDRTQWGGFAANGNDDLALGRNIGQVYGVFAAFQPSLKSPALPLDHDYLSRNSANIAGIVTAEGELARLGPPVWPFLVDLALAARGKAIFERPQDRGGCVECHGISEGEARPPSLHTWKTPLIDAGTDIRQWQILLRSVQTGTLEGATVPGVSALKPTDLSLNVLKTVVTGSLLQAQFVAQKGAPSKAIPATKNYKPGAMMQAAVADKAYVYEARVLQGIWAAAPYLHNGSVPSLAELLKPASARATTFSVGPSYDIDTVGLAAQQPSTSVRLETTGCANRASGDSNCGHEYGTTTLQADEKRALLEYLKTL